MKNDHEITRQLRISWEILVISNQSPMISTCLALFQEISKKNPANVHMFHARITQAQAVLWPLDSGKKMNSKTVFPIVGEVAEHNSNNCWVSDIHIYIDIYGSRSKTHARLLVSE